MKDNFLFWFFMFFISLIAAVLLYGEPVGIFFWVTAGWSLAFMLELTWKRNKNHD